MSPHDGSTELLRLATAGSVDDGKSTLVGRLLYDTKSVLADQMDALDQASAARGTDGEPDLSLLVDGLRSEREQGITIDVAYRYFATPRRSFVLADTPGHVQYTRNTVTGASTAQLAILLVDARHGVVEQTRRHVAVMTLLRVPRLVLAVNKIDLVGYDEGVFDAIAKEFGEVIETLGYDRRDGERVAAVPVSATVGDNVVVRSDRMPWYAGPTLLEHLEAVAVAGPDADAPFRFPIQTVIRPRTATHPDYRGYAGMVTSGQVATGDEVLVLPAGQRTTITGIDRFGTALPCARAGESITLRLAADVGAARGGMIVTAADPPQSATEFAATLAWLHEKALTTGERLLVRHGTATVQAIISHVVDRLDVPTLARVPDPGALEINDIGRVTITVAEPLFLDSYAEVAATGSFLVVDPQTGDTLAAGMTARPSEASSTSARH